jgi:hypothetical protein
MNGDQLIPTREQNVSTGKRFGAVGWIGVALLRCGRGSAQPGVAGLTVGWQARRARNHSCP